MRIILSSMPKRFGQHKARILASSFLLAVLVLALACNKSSNGADGRKADAANGDSATTAELAATQSSGGGSGSGTGANGTADQSAAGGNTATAAGDSAQSSSGTPEKALTPEEQAKAQAKAVEVAKVAEAKRIAAIPVSAPVIKLAGGVYVGQQSVSLSVDTKNAIIMYTTDGSTPDQKKGISYTAPITVSATTEIKAIAFIAGGNTSTEASADYAINEIFVSPTGTGDGNRKNPISDIKAAITKAKSLGIKIIKLSAGSYESSFELSGAITLSGSWQENFSGRSSSPSIIKGVSAGTSTKPAPAYTVKFSGTAANADTKLENLEIRGGEASYSAAIIVSDGATPQLVNVQALGGFGSYGYGVVVFSNGNPVIRGCTLSGGEGATSYGLSVDSARAQVSSSYLVAGSGGVGGYGLSATNARVTVASSVLAGSSANVSYGAAFYNCKNSSLENCTIVGGSGKEGVGVFISAGDPAIVNCIINAQGTVKSYGITDNYGDSAPSALSGNAFIGCAGALYYEVDSKTAYTQCDASGKLLSAAGAALTKPANSGNAVASFSLQGPLFKTPAGAVLPAAKVLTGNAASDITGAARGDAWTVGAYEL